MRPLQFTAAAVAGPLLRFLLVRIGEVSANPDRAKLLPVNLRSGQTMVPLLRGLRADSAARDTEEGKRLLPQPAQVPSYGCPNLYQDGFACCAFGVFALVPTKSLSADLVA